MSYNLLSCYLFSPFYLVSSIDKCTVSKYFGQTLGDFAGVHKLFFKTESLI